MLWKRTASLTNRDDVILEGLSVLSILRTKMYFILSRMHCKKRSKIPGEPVIAPVIWDVSSQTAVY